MLACCARHPGQLTVYCHLSKSFLVSEIAFGALGLLSGSIVGTVSSRSSLILIGTLIPSILGSGCVGTPFTPSTLLALHHSPSEPRRAANALTTPSSVPIHDSFVLVLDPSQIPLLHVVLSGVVDLVLLSWSFL